jgi:hypothetical protein
MTAAGHTPGPWKSDSDGEYIYAIKSDFDYVAIANTKDPCHRANARLIATAPDLLAVMKRVESFMSVMGKANQFLHPNDNQLLEMVGAVIAEATDSMTKAAPIAKARKYRVLYAVTRSEFYEIEAASAEEAKDRGFVDGEPVQNSGETTDVVPFEVEEVMP